MCYFLVLYQQESVSDLVQSAPQEGDHTAYDKSTTTLMLFQENAMYTRYKKHSLWYVLPKVGDISKEELEDANFWHQEKKLVILASSFLKRHIVGACLNNEDVFCSISRETHSLCVAVQLPPTTQTHFDPSEHHPAFTTPQTHSLSVRHSPFFSLALSF